MSDQDELSLREIFLKEEIERKKKILTKIDDDIRSLSVYENELLSELGDQDER
ncbi:hypothetical protein [Thermoplasma sp.]|uniref:hypothetical protein n=1 Tax=Thermoplasma sp. TaxID=1973142 RepID=UPI0026390675|nr:hypothetical protein [Thermoplasma sp.]